MESRFIILLFLLPYLVTSEENSPKYTPQQRNPPQQIQIQQQPQTHQQQGEKRFGIGNTYGQMGGQIASTKYVDPTQIYGIDDLQLYGGMNFLPGYGGKKGKEASEKPNYYQITEMDDSSSSLARLFDFGGMGTMFLTALATSFSVYYVFQFFCSSSLGKKNLLELTDDTAETKPAKKDVLGVDRTSEETKTETKKSRRRRAVKDSEVSRMASIVLSAIESGECLQHSVCLLGANLSQGKAPYYLSIFDKLLPESIRGTHHYNIFKKAIKSGQGVCEQFKCLHK